MIVVLVESFGNHANRMWQDAYLRAFCLSRGWAFVNPTVQNLWQSRRVENEIQGLLELLVYKTVRRMALWNVIIVHELRPGFPEWAEAQRTGLLFVQGWEFRDEEAVSSYREKVLARFRIDRSWKKSASAQALQLRSSAKHVVGVHVRRGDYRDWEGGKYFYSDAVYRRKIIEMETLLEGPVAFVVFSNEGLDERVFSSEAHRTTISKNPWQIDLLLMAECDYLVGPPSTFTMWASFVGLVPTYQIRDPQIPVTMSEFLIYPQTGQ